MRSIVLGIPVVLLLGGASGCGGLPISAAPQGDPRGVKVFWTEERPGAHEWYVMAGAGVGGVTVDAEEETITWDGNGGVYTLEVELVHEDPTETVFPDDGHAMRLGPVVGQTRDGAYVAVGSGVTPATPLEGRVTVALPHNRGKAIVRAADLRATEKLPPEQRERAFVEMHAGSDLAVFADGTFRLITREAPGYWEQKTGLAYPGALVVPEP